MDNEEILKRAIKKAEKRGYRPTVITDWKIALESGCKSHYEIIFSHDFAKAFWPKPHRWQHHLQEMVVEENPLKYLERFLEEEVKSK